MHLHSYRYWFSLQDDLYLCISRATKCCNSSVQTLTAIDLRLRSIPETTHLACTGSLHPERSDRVRERWCANSTRRYNTLTHYAFATGGGSNGSKLYVAFTVRPTFVMSLRCLQLTAHMSSTRCIFSPSQTHTCCTWLKLHKLLGEYFSLPACCKTNIFFFCYLKHLNLKWRKRRDLKWKLFSHKLSTSWEYAITHKGANAWSPQVTQNLGWSTLGIIPSSAVCDVVAASGRHWGKRDVTASLLVFRWRSLGSPLNPAETRCLLETFFPLIASNQTNSPSFFWEVWGVGW